MNDTLSARRPPAMRAAAATVDLDAYCKRVGYAGPRTPTLETLRALHALHPAAIPFEAMDVLLGRGIDLAPAVVDAKLIGAGRGGYCFEQNGLFKRVLETLGFNVTCFAGRVRWMRGPDAPPMPRTHMVLQVTIDGEAWLADVGFGGCTATAPLRRDERAPQPTGHEPFRIVEEGATLVVQALRNETWLPVYAVALDAQFEVDYEMANWFTSTHETSPFKRHLMMARTTPQARYALLDGRLTVRKPDGTTEQRLLDAAAVERALADVFGLPVEPSWRAAIERQVPVKPQP